MHRNKFHYNKTNLMLQFHKFILAWNSTCFGQFLCPSSGVYSLYTQQWYMSYRFVDSFRAVPSWSCSKAVSKPVWRIPLLSVQWINSWRWTDELSETCSFMRKQICEISASSWFYYKEISFDIVTAAAAAGCCNVVEWNTYFCNNSLVLSLNVTFCSSVK